MPIKSSRSASPPGVARARKLKELFPVVNALAGSPTERLELQRQRDSGTEPLISSTESGVIGAMAVQEEGRTKGRLHDELLEATLPAVPAETVQEQGRFSASALVKELSELSEPYTAFITSMRPQIVVRLQEKLDRLANQRGASYAENMALVVEIVGLTKKYRIKLLWSGEHKRKVKEKDREREVVTRYVDQEVRLYLAKPNSPTGQFKLALPRRGSKPIYTNVLAPRLTARAANLDEFPLDDVLVESSLA